MSGNEFENNLYNAPNGYLEAGHRRTTVEDVNSNQTIVTDSDAVSNSVPRLNRYRRIFILEPPVFLLNFATSLTCK